MTAALASPTSSDRTFPLQFGRFVLLEVLGEGGMGAVFRAEMEGPGGFRKPCALKVLHPSVLVAARRLSIDLRIEARLGALLHHPNIVETYDFGIEGKQPWISMELVDGTELSDLLRGAGPMPATAMLEMGIQLASGLEHAHRLTHKGEELGFVHRDLKPSNIILSQNGLAKITDFGIATSALIAGLTTGDGVTKGTPAYMAPEQAAGRDVDGRADLFALGAILYQAATGLRLFRGSSAAATMMSVLHVDEVYEQPGVRAAADAVVPGLARVLGWCLRRDPDARYADATLVREALEELELAAAPGPGLRRWIGDLPGRGTSYRGLRMRRRRFLVAAGAPHFDPRRDLDAAMPVGARLPSSPPPSSPPPSSPALASRALAGDTVPSPAAASGVARIATARRPLWQRLSGSLAVAITLGLLVGMGTGWLAERLASPEPDAAPQPVAREVVAIAIEEADEPLLAPPLAREPVEAPAAVEAAARPTITATRSAGEALWSPVATAPSRSEPDAAAIAPAESPGNPQVAALAGPPLAPPGPERLVVHAGAAAVGEAGEDTGSQESPAGSGITAEGEVWVAHEVFTGTDVEPDAEGADSTPLVLSHPRPVRRVRVGQRPSFIVRSEAGRIASGALLVRTGDADWERHPLTPYGDGFWGTKVYVTTSMERGFDYRFEVEGGGGAVELRDGPGPFRVAVAR